MKEIKLTDEDCNKLELLQHWVNLGITLNGGTEKLSVDAILSKIIDNAYQKYSDSLDGHESEEAK